MFHMALLFPEPEPADAERTQQSGQTEGFNSALGPTPSSAFNCSNSCSHLDLIIGAFEDQMMLSSERMSHYDIRFIKFLGCNRPHNEPG